MTDTQVKPDQYYLCEIPINGLRPMETSTLRSPMQLNVYLYNWLKWDNPPRWMVGIPLFAGCRPMRTSG